MQTKVFFNLVALAVQAMLLTGCVTAKVWEPHQFARFHEPANPPNLQLFYSNSRQDILVRYDETIDTSGKVKRRAYWLERNQTKEGTERRPSFVSVKQTQDLQPIPAGARMAQNFPHAIGLYAVTTNSINFSLYGTLEKNSVPIAEPAKLIGEFELPSYYDALGPVKQVLRTPPAVAADIGLTLILYAPYWWPALNGAVYGK